jgi:Xaa-Pro aminopeptidase
MDLSNPTQHIAVYQRRRAALLAQMQQAGGGVAVIETAPELHRNADSEFPYRFDSNFYYLTGFSEPGAALVLIAGDGSKTAPQSILFCREKNEEREIWDGYRHGPAAARELFGFTAAHDIESFDAKLRELLSNQPTVWTLMGAGLDAKLAKHIEFLRERSRSGQLAPTSVRDLAPLLGEMRLIKDAHELAIMREAGRISAAAHARAMRMCKPGLREYHLEAELLHEFRTQGAESPAYTSIVGTGANSCILHYRAGNTEIKSGDVVLIDAGCELHGYASDITRTFPANGKFTGEQKAIYELVLAAQEASIATVRSGRRFSDYHEASIRTLTDGLIQLKLLEGTVDSAIESLAYRRFYMHGAGHWLGLDVHDAGEYVDINAPYNAEAPEAKRRARRLLAPGMVVTVEPGLYIRPAKDVPEGFWNIGVRIEDDIVVTETGHENLTRGVPVTVAEIEALMRS